MSLLCNWRPPSAVALALYLPGALTSPACAGAAPNALFPPPAVVPAGERDLRDGVTLLHLLSQPVAEDETERHLAFNEHDPTLLARQLLRPEFVPPAFETLFRKKRRWWPMFIRRKIHRQDDAGVARFRAGGLEFQVLDNRGFTVIFCRGQTGRLEMKASKEILGLPEAFRRVFQEEIFAGVKREHRAAGLLTNGQRLERWSLSDLRIAARVPGAPFSGWVSWTPNVLVLSAEKSYGEVAVPGLIFEKPLFRGPGQGGQHWWIHYRKHAVLAVLVLLLVCYSAHRIVRWFRRRTKPS